MPNDVRHKVEQSIGTVLVKADHGGKLLASALGLSGVSRFHRHKRRGMPGEKPGISHIADVLIPPEPGSVEITYTDYSKTRIESGVIADLSEFLAQPMPDWVQVRWLNVSNSHAHTINLFREHFQFHTLNAEDVLHNPQRPRIESFDDHLFVVMRMLQLVQSKSRTALSEQTLDSEQVSLFLYDKVLITFQEKPGDVWQSIRNRLQVENSRIRKLGTGYLLYALLDAVVDHCFPVLERYGDLLENLELATLEQPSPQVLHQIHGIKRELALLRRIDWPMREVVDQLYRDDNDRIETDTRPYLRDVYEHTIQIVEILESYREMASGLTDLYMSTISNRTNEIMKVLTIIATVFIPLTFITGVYGMNFQFMPELSWRWSYFVLWAVFIVLITAMLVYFKRKGWIGRN